LKNADMKALAWSTEICGGVGYRIIGAAACPQTRGLRS
jgi:hypothetical protein